MADADEPTDPTESKGDPTEPAGARAEPAAATPRGAGWDDEDDFKHVDHGPRPEVPNHGARPFLMGVPILLITIAAIVAIVISKSGDDKAGAATGSGASSASATSSGSAAASSGSADAASGDTAAITKALVNGSQYIPGLAKPSLVAAATCKAAGEADLYDCTYGAGAKERTLRLELKNGVLSKRLAGDTGTTAPLDSVAVGGLLVADDAAGGEKTKYACASSTGRNPDGSSAGDSAMGFLCISVPVGGGLAADGAKQRFVQFADDGTATRDFAITDQ